MVFTGTLAWRTNTDESATSTSRKDPPLLICSVRGRFMDWCVINLLKWGRPLLSITKQPTLAVVQIINYVCFGSSRVGLGQRPPGTSFPCPQGNGSTPSELSHFGPITSLELHHADPVLVWDFQNSIIFLPVKSYQAGCGHISTDQKSLLPTKLTNRTVKQRKFLP